VAVPGQGTPRERESSSASPVCANVWQRLSYGLGMLRVGPWITVALRRALLIIFLG
jgi:tagatose-1,6-bisphosphate aldolase non-catalytic subunit AgaZ/GatZ